MAFVIENFISCLIIITCFFIILYVINNLSNKKSEGFDTTMGNQSVQFYSKDDRYIANNNSTKKTCGSSLPYVDPSNMQCMKYGNCPVSFGGKPIDWDVKHDLGANSTCQDLVYHSIEPRMVVTDNGMKCNVYGNDNKYRTPVGTSSDLLSLYDNNIEVPQMEIEKMVGDSILTPEIIPGYTLSQPMTNGLNSPEMQSLKSDCIAKNVNDSYRCNTSCKMMNNIDNFGKYTYNFHK